jgi:hypothetical protein
MRPAIRILLTDVSRDGRVLVGGGARELLFGRLVRTRARSRMAQIRGLPDQSGRPGRALHRGGEQRCGIYLRPADGSPAVRLAGGERPPDGKWALVLERLGRSTPRLLRVPTGAGTPEPVPVGDLVLRGAAWLPDGQRIYLRAAAPGKDSQGYLMELPNGPPRPFGPASPQWAVFSPDSRLALIGRADGKQLIYPVDGGEPRPVPGLRPEEIGDMYSPVGPFTGDGAGVYLAHYRDMPVRIERIELADGRRAFWKDFAPSDRSGVLSVQDYTIGADGRSYAYTIVRSLSDALYVLDGLK